MSKDSFEGAITSALFSNKNKLCTEDEIDKCINEFAKLSIFSDLSDVEIECVRKSIHSKQLIKLDIGTVLMEKNHKKWFMAKKSHLDMSYWNRYKNYLINDKKFSQNVVDSMDDVSDEIVDLLGDPQTEYGYQRRGLVIGDVQSGKTANYISVINKAADAGYKIVVLLTGTIEKLRKQTQIRIDEGFIGKSSGRESDIIGVGKYDPSIQPSFFTTIYDDFKSTSSKLLGISLDGLNETCILVVKKNVTVLKNLNQWIKSRNINKVSNVINNSLLVIDDEADNASINTNDEDKNPTKINGQIRILLKLFTKTSYIGFTATPYANIFIDPYTKEDEMFADDLFPRDYIYCLDAPTNYIGARNIFGDDAKFANMISPIRDAEDYYPQSHKIDFRVDSLSPSLETALNEFYLCNVIRDLRGDVTSHRSMLVNISRFVNVQYQLGDVINRHLKQTKDAVRCYCKLPVIDALKSITLKELKKTFDENFENVEFTWDDIQPNLSHAIEPIQVFVVNANKNDLDYEANETYGLRAICVGGFTLSRGLTLEGLVVSYFYRNSKVYDTLMQMGRWFGYRPGYEDICKIWMSDDSINWYSEISKATDELRDDIKYMKENGNTPKDFGLRVRRDSTVLMITARNKMRNATSIPLLISLSGEFLETTKLYNSREKNENNLNVINNFINNCSLTNKIVSNENSSTSFGYKSIKKSEIIDLISNFDVSRSNIKFNKESLVNFISNYKGNELDLWDVVFLNGSDDLNKQLITENNYVNRMKRSYILKNNDYLIQISGTKNRLGSSSDATFGLSRKQVEEIASKFKEEHPEASTINEKWYFKPFVKRNPLLMVYFVSLRDESKFKNKLDKNLNDIPLIGLSIGIPSLTDKDTEYVTYYLNVIEQQNFLDYNEEFGDDLYE